MLNMLLSQAAQAGVRFITAEAVVLAVIVPLLSVNLPVAVQVPNPYWQLQLALIPSQ
jgi:hypothetical protein